MTREHDARVLRIAAGQHGVVTAAQLMESGLSRSAIARRRQVGQLASLGRGLYLVEALRTPHSLLSAGLLALPDAVVGYRSAAQLHGMQVWQEGPSRPELIVVKGKSRHFRPAIVHQTRSLGSADIVTVEGLAVTSPARTLCDLAQVLRPTTLSHVIQEQLIKRQPEQGELLACHRALARPGRTGTTVVRELLVTLLDDEPFPASELEILTIELLHRYHAPPTRRHYVPPWFDGVRGVVDFAEPQGRTILEADGRRWHATVQAQNDDARRDRIAARHGWQVLRVGWHELRYRPEATMNEVLDAMGQRLADAGAGQRLEPPRPSRPTASHP